MRQNFVITKLLFPAVCLFMISVNLAGQEICTLNDYIDINGYRVWNNPGSPDAGPQCIRINSGNSFTVTSNPDGGGGVYPKIFKGCHWGTWCTPNSGMPVRINNISSLPTSWSVSGTSAPGHWNAAYDLWISKNGGTAPDAIELMIWLYWKGYYWPTGSQIGTVSIEGRTWELWRGQFFGWEYIAYKLANPITSVNMDIKPFINDLISRGICQSTWWVDAVEAGFEIGTEQNSGVGLISNQFYCQVNAGGSSCTPTSITPNIQINDGSWQQASSVTVNSGAKV